VATFFWTLGSEKASATGAVAELRGGSREVVRVVGVLDVGDELAAVAGEMEAAAEPIANGPPRAGIDVRDREVPPRRSAAIFAESSRSFLALAPWIAFL